MPGGAMLTRSSLGKNFPQQGITAMRKAMAALVLGTLVLGQTVSAIAATAKPAAPTAAVAGRINNRAVLGLTAAQGAADSCVPKSAEDKSCEAGEGNGKGGGGGNGLPVVLGIAGAIGLGVAAGAGGGKGPASP